MKVLKIGYFSPPCPVSPEVFKIPVGDEIIVYAPRLGILGLFEKSEEKAREKFVQKLSREKNGICVASVEGISNFCLDITRRCNMECSYCFSRLHENLVLDFNIVKKVCKYVISHADQVLEISFIGGGEPTLAFNELVKIYNYVHKLASKEGIEVYGSIVTNGVFNEKVLKWLIDRDFQITLSFDGPPEIQNKQRPLKGGLESYEIVASTLKKLQKFDANYEIRVTVTEESLPRMLDILKHFENLGVKKLWIKPAYIRSITGGGLSLEAFVKEFLKCFEYARKRNINVLFSLSNLSLKENFCGVCGANFVLTIHGYISACPGVIDPEDPASETFFYGKVTRDGIKIFRERLEKLRNRKVYQIEACRNCFAKWICAGGCSLEALHINNSIFKPVKEICFLSRELLKRTFYYMLKGDKNPPMFQVYTKDLTEHYSSM